MSCRPKLKEMTSHFLFVVVQLPRQWSPRFVESALEGLCVSSQPCSSTVALTYFCMPMETESPIMRYCRAEAFFGVSAVGVHAGDEQEHVVFVCCAA